MKKIKLSSIFDIARGGSPRPIQDYLTDDKNGINWIMIGDTIEGNKYIEKTAKKIKPSGIKKSRKVYVGDFLLTNSMSFGRPYILKIDGCIHDGWLVLSPRSPNISTDYFYYLLSSQELKSEMGKQAAGAVVKNLNSDIVRNIEVKYPNLPTQTKIAKILDKADQIRQKRKKAIELADEFLRSLFLEMFGDPVVNPKGWEVEKLVNLSVAKPTYGAGASAISYNHKFRYIRITDILENGTLNNDKKSAEIDEKEIEKYLLNDGDILFARSGATVGKTFLFTDKIEKSIYAGYLIRFQINKNKVLPEYIFNFTKTAAYQSWVKSHIKTVAQPNINAQQYSDLEIIIPPMEIQIKFVEIVNKIEKYKENLGKQVQFSDELFNSLSQQYFTKAE